MYIKSDFDYNELKRVIDEENLWLYELIKEKGKQDLFTEFIENYFYDKHTVTITELNHIMKDNKIGIIKALMI